MVTLASAIVTLPTTVLGILKSDMVTGEYWVDQADLKNALKKQIHGQVFTCQEDAGVDRFGGNGPDKHARG